MVLEANKRLFAYGSFRSGTPATPLVRARRHTGRIRGVAVERENWNRRKALPEPGNRPRPREPPCQTAFPRPTRAEAPTAKVPTLKGRTTETPSRDMFSYRGQPAGGAGWFWRRISAFSLTVPFEAERPQHRLSEHGDTQAESAVLQWSEKIGTVEKRFLSRETVRARGNHHVKRLSLGQPGLKPLATFKTPWPPGNRRINPTSPVPTGALAPVLPRATTAPAGAPPPRCAGRCRIFRSGPSGTGE